MSQVTMNDVARAAGVSVMTVSNVVNGRPNVGQQTRRRVLDVIDELGYEVNLTARRLRAGRANTIALVVPRFEHPYFGELAARFTDEFARHGRHLVVEQSGASPEGELNAVSHARLQMYDGVVLSVVGMRYEDVDRLRPGVPIVLLGEHALPERFDHVAMANAQGAELATQHLLQHGSRRVAIVGGTPDATEAGAAELRTQGWRAAHRAAGVEVDERLIIEVPGLETAQARSVLRQRLEAGLELDAVFAVTDQVAIGVHAALDESGFTVPQDVQVIGFDNLSIGEHLVPSLTSVDPSNGWIVEQAVSLLLRRIEGEDLSTQHLVAPVSLVERGSTRRSAARADPDVPGHH